MPQRVEIAVGQRVVRFIDDDQAEVIPRPPLTAFFTHERLDRGDDDRRIERRPLFAHLHLGLDAGGGAELVHRLGDEFLAVGEDQRALRLVILRQTAEQDRLARTGRQHAKLAVEFLKALVDVLPGFHLIGAEAHLFRMVRCHLRRAGWG